MKPILFWGFILWFIGYVLGFVFYAFVPNNLIGWVIMPLGTIITVWVVWKKFRGTKLSYYLKVGLNWTVLAMIFDYLFLVLLLKPTDGYYKLDVYLYYFLTLIIPLLVGWVNNRRNSIS
ncbi:MAG: hypothetical protein V1846_01705 [Candidatus Komeilibacteria bacterium]